MMIGKLLERGRPSHVAVAVAGGGPAVTYDQLRHQVDGLSVQLNELGIGRQDRVAVVLPNGLEMIVAFFAAAIAGAAAPLNPAYKLDEFRFYLEDTDARALIVPRGGADGARRAAGRETLIIETDVDAQGRVGFSSAGRAGPSRSPVRPGPDNVALILHTSGTTARPKRVPLSHGNLAASARHVAETYRLGPDDVAFCVMPLFHIHGLVASTLATLLTGGTVVIGPRFNALSFWSTVRDHRVTWYSASPTVHRLLLKRARAGARPPGAEHLRFIRSCSSPLSAQMMAEMEEKFGAPVLEAYGMTEAAHQMTSNPLPPGVRKPSTVGCGTGVSVAILDEAGRAAPGGRRGEVAVKGPNVFAGYEDDPEANAESFVDGWFRTGDEGVLDGDGYLTLTGRIKELINRGGEKISPREIDEALLAHPAVSEAVCFGIPDRVYGEEVAAAVVLEGEATESELKSHCQALLADFKCPKVIHIVDAIPRTAATGKVQRRVVAAEMAKRGGG